MYGRPHRNTFNGRRMYVCMYVWWKRSEEGKREHEQHKGERLGGKTEKRDKGAEEEGGKDKRDELAMEA